MASREALLAILEEANIAEVFTTSQAQATLFHRIDDFGSEYEKHLGVGKGGLPSTATLDDLV